MSRSVVQCGTDGDAIKRGRWYTYDSQGRLERETYAIVSGTRVGTPATMAYRYDAAGRMQSYTSPLNAAFGTHYEYGATDGRISSATTTTTPGSLIASNLTYRAFGELVAYRTGSTQAVAEGTRTLTVTNAYRQDDALVGIERGYVGDGATSTIDLLQQELAYTPVGQLRQRTDVADASNSRHYEYDTLERMTCEARGNATSGDCSAASGKLAGLFSYGNGQSSTSPPDARLSAVIQAGSAQYVSSAPEVYTYTGGVARPTSVTRGDGNLVVGYDGIGRRAFEYQAVSASTGQTMSRRDYAYLPNGQLGEIRGWTLEGQPYSVAMRYDVEGRPNTISYSSGDNYELFWDDMNRLVAASIEGAHNVRWSYHYVGQTLVAATREIEGAVTDVKRFWAISDERGLIFRMVDEQGATYWQARWDATGWRSVEGTPQPDMWVPFGLSGQLIVEHTEAAPVSTSSSVRPSIVLNQLRAYDPLFGAFLQPDPADQSSRLLPEGYLLARGDYLGHVDSSGANSKIRQQYNKLIWPGWELAFDGSCAGGRVAELQAAIDQAIADIDSCPLEKCGAAGFAPSLRKQWIFALLTGINYCISPNGELRLPRAPTTIANSDGFIVADTSGTLATAQTLIAYGGTTLGGRRSVFTSVSPCLARSVAHEAMHGVFKTLPISLISPSEPTRDGWGVGELYYGVVGDWTWDRDGELDEDKKMIPYLNTCIHCARK